jgi:hypothetical protein
VRCCFARCGAVCWRTLTLHVHICIYDEHSLPAPLAAAAVGAGLIRVPGCSVLLVLLHKDAEPAALQNGKLELYGL